MTATTFDVLLAVVTLYARIDAGAWSERGMGGRAFGTYLISLVAGVTLTMRVVWS